MRLDKDKIKESLTQDDVIKVLNKLGSVEPRGDSYGNPIFTTVCHHGDSHKLYYYKESMMFKCYTNCGNMDIYGVVINARESEGHSCSFYDAIKFVADTTGKQLRSNHIQKTNSNIVDDWEWINRVTHKKPRVTEELPSYNTNVLEVFLPYPHVDWLKEIQYDTQIKYGVRYYPKENQIIVPHYSKDDRLVGIRSRNLDREKVEDGLKYIPTTVAGQQYRHQTSLNLYGLNITKETIKKDKRVYIFEGEKSVMIADDYYNGCNFSVAVSGSNISNYQVEEILSLDVEDVVIAFDKFRAKLEQESDELYEKRLFEYAERLARLGRKFAPYARTYVIWDSENKLNHKDSPVDQGKEVFEYLTDTKKEITTD